MTTPVPMPLRPISPEQQNIQRMRAGLIAAAQSGATIMQQATNPNAPPPQPPGMPPGMPGADPSMGGGAPGTGGAPPPDLLHMGGPGGGPSLVHPDHPDNHMPPLGGGASGPSASASPGATAPPSMGLPPGAAGPAPGPPMPPPGPLPQQAMGGMPFPSHFATGGMQQHAPAAPPPNSRDRSFTVTPDQAPSLRGGDLMPGVIPAAQIVAIWARTHGLPAAHVLARTGLGQPSALAQPPPTQRMAFGGNPMMTPPPPPMDDGSSGMDGGPDPMLSAAAGGQSFAPPQGFGPGPSPAPDTGMGSLAIANAGPPAPRAFLQWLQHVAPGSNDPGILAMAEQYANAPGTANMIYNSARQEAALDPKSVPADLAQVLGVGSAPRKMRVPPPPPPEG